MEQEKRAIDLFYRGCKREDLELVSFLVDNKIFQPTHEILNEGARLAYTERNVPVLGYLYDHHPEPFDLPICEALTECIVVTACRLGIKPIEARHQLDKKESRREAIEGACANGHTDLLKTLLNKSIKMGDNHDLKLLFHLAYFRRHYETAKVLFKYLAKKEMVEFFFDVDN